MFIHIVNNALTHTITITIAQENLRYKLFPFLHCVLSSDAYFVNVGVCKAGFINKAGSKITKYLPRRAAQHGLIAQH